MQDAVALANWLGVLNSSTIEAAEQVFEEYKAERYPVAKAAYNNGRGMSKVTARVLSLHLLETPVSFFTDWDEIHEKVNTC